MSPRSPCTLRPVVTLLLAWAALLPAGRVHAAAVRLADAFVSAPVNWNLSDRGWHRDGGQVFVVPGGAEAIATYTVPVGAAGFYTIADSSLRRDVARPGTIAFRVAVRRADAADGRQSAPVVVAHLDAGELFDFDAFLGYLAAGDAVEIAIGPDGDPAGDRTAIDFAITRAPAIPVSAYPANHDNWVRLDDVQVWSPAARHRAWHDRPAGAEPLVIPAHGREIVLALRAPQSGYYALHDARMRVTGGALRARLHVGDETKPRREFVAETPSQPMGLDADIGYVARGALIWLSFAGESGARAEFLGSVVEWAPRRAPLRVRRGEDAFLDVYEPAAPRHGRDVPAGRWITVPAPGEGIDATEAIRDALARAAATRRGGHEYAGIRLDRGKTYTIAAAQNGGAIFSLRDARRVIFDGNGATLHVASPELSRRDLELFTVHGGGDIVFHDLIVTGASIPFTTGEILDVSPRGENTQTVTFRVDPGALDPLADISRDGRNNAYAYDPQIPGRLAPGTWTHYPGSGTPSIQATNTPGVFTHRVTRTGDSIESGGKWLIKNKRAGVIYLTTRGGTENVTLSAIDGHASGGGTLRFWQTSGVNILDCTFEPEGGNWISSSADGVHGRGREGVWIENTLIRGVCEDIMNTYGQNMIVLPDDDPADAVMTIRMFNRSSESFDDGAMPLPREENAVVGDQLVFFNPNTGRVLGYAHIVAIADGRFTLSNPVAGIEPWREGAGTTATMVYNTAVAGRFFVRDSRLMDSMRFGIYIKARGGVVFGSQFEGLSAPSIFATNEPEWPEGPPATHLWVEGCTFSQNNHGYMPRHRDFMVVDPADISVYTRRFRDPAEPDDFRAHLTHGQFANSHVKLLGNVFHDWRGMGISVRNARNVRIEDNLFLPPVNDDVMRATLAEDPALRPHNGRGVYAAIHLDSADGVRARGNRFVGLPAGDRGIVSIQAVTGLVATDNESVAVNPTSATVALSFTEWFGTTSREAPGMGTVVDAVRLGGATHRAGRLGAGLAFAGGPPAVLAASADLGGQSLAQFTISLWTQPVVVNGAEASVWAMGDTHQRIVLGLRDGRWFARVVQAVLDLGAAVPGQWQHLALGFDGATRTLSGFVDGVEVAKTNEQIPADLAAPQREGELGRGFHGMIDELRFYPSAINRGELAALALRRLPDGR